MTVERLGDDERKTLWRQYAQVHAESQETYDSSVRTLAAAGLAATLSLATTLQNLDGWGVATVAALLVALAANLLSFATAQLDMRRRLEAIRSDSRGAESVRAMRMDLAKAPERGPGLLAPRVAARTRRARRRQAARRPE